MSVKIVYQDSAPGAAEGTTTEFNVPQPFNNPGDILDSDITTPAVATCEYDYWLLDGSFDVFPDTPESAHLGIWSEMLCDETGAFAVPPVLTLTLDALYSSVGLTMTFDPHGPDWCDDLTIIWYRAGEEIARGEFMPDAATYICAQEVHSFDKVSIIFRHMSKPYRYLKLTKLIYGVVREFDTGELFSFGMYQTASVISDNLEASTMEVSLRNKSAIPFLFQRKQPLRVEHNGNLLGVYYICDSEQTGRNAYRLECEDALTLLADADSHKGGVYDGIMAPELIADIMGDISYELDPVFEDVRLYGYLPLASRMENLAQVAFAIGAEVDTSRSEILRLFPPGEEAPVEYYDANTRYMEGASKTRRSLTTEVQVTAHTYRESDTYTQIYSGVLDGTATITLTEPVSALAIEGGTISDWGHNWATITGDGGKVILTGAQYNHDTLVYVKRNPLVNAGDLEKVVEVKNCTLVSTYNAEEVLDRVYMYYLKRDTFTAQVLPGAAKPGDRVKVDTDFDGVREGVLITLDWTGSHTMAAQAEILLDYLGE